MTILWKNVWSGLLRLQTVRRLHDECPALPSSRQTFYEHILCPARALDHSVSSIADQIRKRHSSSLGSGRFRRLRSLEAGAIVRVVSSNAIPRFVRQRFHCPDAVLRMAHLHNDMERVDIHVALKSADHHESATLLNDVFDCEKPLWNDLTTKDTEAQSALVLSSCAL
jgi:hypothetical protein